MNRCRSCQCDCCNHCCDCCDWSVNSCYMDMWYDYWNSRSTNCANNTRNRSCGRNRSCANTAYTDTAVANCGNGAYTVDCTYGCNC